MSPEFYPQLFERIFKEKTPKFYAIIRKNSLWFTAASILVPLIVTDVLPGMGMSVPMWLTYANIKIVALCSVLAGMGIGGAAIASTTIKGQSPPLVSGSLTQEELVQQMADLQTKYEILMNSKPDEK